MGRSTFLFAAPGWSRGFARAIDLGATLSGHSYFYSVNPEAADHLAASQDWAAVGDDLREAVGRLQQELAHA